MGPEEEHASIMSLSHENHVLKERIADLEAKVVPAQHDDWQKEAMSLHRLNETLSGHLDTARERADKAEAKVKELEKLLGDGEARVQSLIGAKDKRIADLEGVVKTYRQDAEQLGDDCQRYLKRIAELEADVEQRRQTLELRNTSILRLKARIAELKEYEATVRSIAAMVGWMNLPPRRILEADIRALKARAVADGE